MRNLNRLESYALAATAVTASIVTSANAAVVRSGPVSIVVPANIDGVYLNVLTGATGSSGSSVAGWDINPYSGSGLTFGTPAASDTGGVARLGTTASPNTNVSNLAGGVLVGNLPGMWFSTSAASASITAPTGRPFILNSTNNFVGFRFLNEATNSIHYGYLQFQIGATLTSRTIIEYGYESVAGASILVPAPGAAALLGVAGLVGTRRRRA
jgi:MYXO-CTERM domain-containing protein